MSDDPTRVQLVRDLADVMDVLQVIAEHARDEHDAPCVHDALRGWMIRLATILRDADIFDGSDVALAAVMDAKGHDVEGTPMVVMTPYVV